MLVLGDLEVKQPAYQAADASDGQKHMQTYPENQVRTQVLAVQPRAPDQNPQAQAPLEEMEAADDYYPNERLGPQDEISA